MDKIFLRSIVSADAKAEGELLYILTREISKLLETKNLRLIIIDSICGIYRTLFETSDKMQLVSRSQSLFQLAATLKQLSSKYKCKVVVTNQVSDSFSNILDTSDVFRSLYGRRSRSRVVIPTLGWSWATCLTTRIMLTREMILGRVVRMAHLLQSPHRPSGECHFIITTGGFKNGDSVGSPECNVDKISSEKEDVHRCRRQEVCGTSSSKIEEPSTSEHRKIPCEKLQEAMRR
uniref:RecA family profile 1 domain-containing protein n=1 Tax=Amorphochlora amoebiformis TaxID=1561963 RepID=A0A7S0DTF4_9EUKA|mmetsp:Transcript_8506/g.13337  ORF Transcript_8506/g.13337 Transcript_8506/m.13337 type:complete len:234 (+) Transcript_8506:1-702(+)